MVYYKSAHESQPPARPGFLLTINAMPGQYIHILCSKGCYVWMHIPTLRVFWTANNVKLFMTSTMSHCWVRTLCAWVRKRCARISPYFAHLIAYPCNNNVRIQQWNHCWCHNSLSNGAPQIIVCLHAERHYDKILKGWNLAARHCERTKLGYRVPQLGRARPALGPRLHKRGSITISNKNNYQKWWLCIY